MIYRQPQDDDWNVRLEFANKSTVITTRMPDLGKFPDVIVHRQFIYIREPMLRVDAITRTVTYVEATVYRVPEYDSP